MNNVEGRLRLSLLKRQEALERFQAKKKAFLISKEQVIKDIEEARTIWQQTLEQLPEQPFRH